MSVHVLPMATAGQAVIQRGPLWASWDTRMLKISGPAPALDASTTGDIAHVAAQVVTALYDLVEHEGQSTEPVIFRVRSLKAEQGGHGTPSQAAVIVAFLFCSGSSVYRIVHAYRTGSLGIRIDPDGRLSVAVQTSILMPWLTRSLRALLKAAPWAYGWCRTRWSCATLAATLQAKHGIEVSAETVRRWLHERG